MRRGDASRRCWALFSGYEIEGGRPDMISEGADIGEKRQRISDVVGVASAIANVSADGTVRGVALVGVRGRMERGGRA